MYLSVHPASHEFTLMCPIPIQHHGVRSSLLPSLLVTLFSNSHAFLSLLASDPSFQAAPGWTLFPRCSGSDSLCQVPPPWAPTLGHHSSPPPLTVDAHLALSQLSLRTELFEKRRERGKGFEEEELPVP